jgi:hypothetical protein
MGTILNGRVDLFRTIVAALAKHKDLQLVLSVGDQVDPKKIGPVKPVYYHPDAIQPTAAYSVSVIDFFEAGHRQSSESERTGKEAAIEQGHRKALYWLISLAALISLLVGVLCLLEPATTRTAGTDQLDLAAGLSS